MRDAHQILEQLQMGMVYEAEIGDELEVSAICQQLADFGDQEPQLAAEISGILRTIKANQTSGTVC